MNRVAIVDYGMCNLDSVARAVEECGGTPVITANGQEIESADRIILPGVGAFPDAMRGLRERSLDEILFTQVSVKQTPFLGICLGMQLLASHGLEVETTSGLGWLPGEVMRLEPFGADIAIPHVGWNEVDLVRESPLFAGIESGKDFYFVHSYQFVPKNEEHVVARTAYGRGFVSALQHENIFAVQFHPEKSQRPGFRVLTNFLKI